MSLFPGHSALWQQWYCRMLHLQALLATTQCHFVGHCSGFVSSGSVPLPKNKAKSHTSWMGIKLTKLVEACLLVVVAAAAAAGSQGWLDPWWYVPADCPLGPALLWALQPLQKLMRLIEIQWRSHGSLHWLGDGKSLIIEGQLTRRKQF